MTIPDQFFLSITHDLKDKRVLLRIDINTPFTGNTPTDPARIEAALSTLKELSNAGAKVIALAHYGEKGESLETCANYLSEKLPRVTFVNSLDKAAIENKLHELTAGDIAILENVRLFPGETENRDDLAQWFATLGDLYVNDAFPVSHRLHASVAGVTKHILSYLGPNMHRELHGLSFALNPEKPCLMILGGAKLSTKLPLIESFLHKDCYVYVGGAMVHNILVAKGLSIGESLVDKDYKPSEYVLTHEKLLIPKDVICNDHQTYQVNQVPNDQKIVDCGKDTLTMLAKVMEETKTIIMNGPVGLYEDGFKEGTEGILSEIGARADINTIIGGGDTLTVMNHMGTKPKFGFVSLGGGAMLDYLRDGTLVALDALIESRKE